MTEDKLIVDLDNTITIDSSNANYESKEINLEVAKAIKNAAELGLPSTIFSSRNMKTFDGDLKKIFSPTPLAPLE